MMISKLSIFTLAAILALGTLWPSVPVMADTKLSATPPTQTATVEIVGTVRKLAVEGTCYQLNADGGQKYELIGKFPKRDGARIKVSGTVATDMVTICQVGQPFKVKNFKLVK
jgi:hypothetical protein